MATNTSLAVQRQDQFATTVITTAPPVGEEWSGMVRQAEMLSKTGFVPKYYQGKPAELLACMMTARELGIGPMFAMRKIAIIQGTPTMEAELMVALVRRAGHNIGVELSATAATASGRRRDTGDEATYTFTIEMAKRAKLLEKDNWRNWPESMLWARAASQLCRMLFPDALMGVTHTPEEMGAEVDRSGAVRFMEPEPAPVDGAGATPASGGLTADQKQRLKELNDSLPPDLKMQPAERRALLDDGFEAAEKRLLELHERARPQGQEPPEDASAAQEEFFGDG